MSNRGRSCGSAAYCAVNQAIAARMMELDSRALVELVSIGTMEASRNLLLGGAGALVVLASGGGLSLLSRRTA